MKITESEVPLSAGVIRYQDTGGAGPCVVLLHGAVMDGTLWRKVLPELADRYRCVVPTLPLGAHRVPMRPGADLSIDGLAMLVAEFLDRLDLREVTLVMNDWGGPQLLVEHGRTERVSRLVLVACEAFDNFPPGAPGRMLARLAALPGGLGLLAGVTRSARGRRATMAPMAKRPIPDEVLRGWFAPLADRRVRADLRRYCVSVPAAGDRAWSAGLGRFTGPALVVWATEDRLMPRSHGAELASLLPAGRLVELDDCYTLIPEDQPRRLAAELRAFIG